MDPESDKGQELPVAPKIPPFDSLRTPRRRSAADVLMAETPLGRATSGPAGTPRPATYADLLHFGVRLVRGAACVPGRLARWSVREPVHRLRHLLGQ
jgi:hypothetical protein